MCNTLLYLYNPIRILVQSNLVITSKNKTQIIIKSFITLHNKIKNLLSLLILSCDSNIKLTLHNILQLDLAITSISFVYKHNCIIFHSTLMNKHIFFVRFTVFRL